MTKRVFLIHGWDGYPEEGWRPWLKTKLEEKGFQVFSPAMPDTSNPNIEKWIPFLEKTVGQVGENLYFVGHSLGCVTILRFLENLKTDQKIGGCILIAGFGHDLDYSGYNHELVSFFRSELNWDKVRKHCKNFVVIQSGNDPWVPENYGQELRERLKTKYILLQGMKHFSGDDGVKELPEALRALLEIADEN